jgi:hypothetical protein
MKAGRPAYHIRSKWLTIVKDGRLMYFELDKKGNLVSKTTHDQITAHHAVAITAPEKGKPSPPPPRKCNHTELSWEQFIAAGGDIPFGSDFGQDWEMNE